MMLQRTFGLFAAVFAVVYTLAFEFHWELFSYHPREVRFGWLQQPSIAGGPVMHWYGAIATGALAALAACGLALPVVRNRPLPNWLGWGVPLVSLLVWMWLLRVFFLR